MYEGILVPLDQSELAEQALPHAVALAEAFGATIHLVSVVAVQAPEAVPSAGMAAEWEEQIDRARQYMSGIRKRIMTGTKIETEWDVCQGDVAEEILRYCVQQECELIVMSTHGRSGTGRWVYGSIADRILRRAPASVLLVRSVEED